MSAFSENSHQDAEKDSAFCTDFKTQQCLVSQVLHDVISGFTAVAAGIDFGPQGDLWDMVVSAKTQLHHLLCLLRFAFSTSEGTAQDAHAVLSGYAVAHDITLHGQVHTDSIKLTLAAALWMGKHRHPGRPTDLILAPHGITGCGAFFAPSDRTATLLSCPAPARSPQESYACYLADLAQRAGYRIQWTWQDHRMDVTWIHP